MGAVSAYLIRKVREIMSPRGSIQKLSFNGMPVLLAYHEAQLKSALALILQAGQVQTLYLITCPVRLRSLSTQCQPPPDFSDRSDD